MVSRRCPATCVHAIPNGREVIDRLRHAITSGTIQKTKSHQRNIALAIPNIRFGSKVESGGEDEFVSDVASGCVALAVACIRSLYPYPPVLTHCNVNST